MGTKRQTRHCQLTLVPLGRTLASSNPRLAAVLSWDNQTSKMFKQFANLNQIKSNHKLQGWPKTPVVD